MNERLEKLLKEKSGKINEWVDTINLHNRQLLTHEKLSDEEPVDLTLKVATVLAQVSELYFRYGSFKDSFDNSKMSIHFWGPDLIIQSSKTKSVFNLGIDNKGIYLSTHLVNAQNLCYMDDSFYSDFLSLERFGKFELEENERYGQEIAGRYGRAFKSKKSKLFSLIRNYVAGSADDNHLLLGTLQVYWGYETDFYDMLVNSCQAFKILYGLNYSLWKMSDVQMKQNKWK